MRRQTLTRRQMLTLVSVPLTVAGSGTFTEAHAETFWQAVGDLQIGGVHFSVGVHSPPDGYYGQRPGYYYRTKDRLKHKKHRCGPYCYGHGGYVYHHDSCAVLGAHMQQYGAPPTYYAPRYWGLDEGYRNDIYGYSYRRGAHGYGRGKHHHRGRGRGHRRGRGRGHW